MKHLSCHEPGGETQGEVDIKDVGRYSCCGNRHENIVLCQAENSLCVDTLSWLAKSISEGAWHIYSS